MGKTSLTKKPKLHYHPTSNCYLIFTTKSSPSLSESDIELLWPAEVKQKFKFNLLCDDLRKAVTEAENFRMKSHGAFAWPPELKVPKSKIEIVSSWLDVFVVYKVSAEIGYGVYTNSALEIGCIIAEYVGELKARSTSIHDSTYTHKMDNRKVIDAKDYGNIARFFSHCPSEHPNERVMTANVASIPWKVSKDITKIFFVTLRDIKAGEPICFDYGERWFPEGSVQYFDANAPHKPLPLGSIKTPEHHDEL